VAVSQEGIEACTVTMSPDSASFSKDAATGTVSVTAPASCEWTAASGAGWLTITAPGSGRGSAVLTYNVARNTTVNARTATITAADATHTVSQSGDLGACAYQVAPVEIAACMSVPYDLTTTVTTQPACGWTVAPDAAWITPSGVSSRVGSGEVRFRVGDNYDVPRLGVLKLRWDTPTAGQNVRVSQAGCRYAVSTTGLSVPADGGMFSFDVYQQSDPLECGGPLQNGCVWTASSDATWITITSPMPHAGDDRVSFQVSSNPGALRSAQIAVRDKTVVIVQAAR
jgi:Viral BACON domain/Putative binding domain, N-terminal